MSSFVCNTRTSIPIRKPKIHILRCYTHTIHIKCQQVQISERKYTEDFLSFVHNKFSKEIRSYIATLDIDIADVCSEDYIIECIDNNFDKWKYIC